ncbi:MAG: hypothetical protein M0Z31_13830 [Clostridia bacterium]|nr:hypothetical protein [Clostridia bacterium]
MLDLFKKTFFMGMGVLSLTKEKAEKLVEELVEKGEVGTEEAKQFAKEMVERGEQEKAVLKETVKNELIKIKREIGLITKEEFTTLEQRIEQLEAKLMERQEGI